MSLVLDGHRLSECLCDCFSIHKVVESRDQAFNTMFDFVSSQSVLDECGHLVNRDFLLQNTDVVLPVAVFCQPQFIGYANRAAGSGAVPQDPTLITACPS